MAGSPDNADVYSWDGASFARVWDATASGLPSGANVNGYARVDDTHFYLSFIRSSTTLPGLGTVQDEDVVYYDDGAWSVYFDGTALGLTSDSHDLDAISIVGGVLYFSTSGNARPPGVGGSGDNADIYRWDGASFARVWDATANGLPGSANIDGLHQFSDTDFALSFSSDTTVPGLGTVQDEDIVRSENGAWSVYFDGTSEGLTSGAHDLNGFDVGAGASPAGS